MSSRRSVRQLLVAVLLGVLVGGGLMAVTPAGAEVSNAVATNWKKIWKKNLKPLADKRYYTKAQSDTKYGTKADVAAANAATDTKLGGYYKKTESDAKYAGAGSSYTKAESDAKYAPAQPLYRGTVMLQELASGAGVGAATGVSFGATFPTAPIPHYIKLGDAIPAGCSGTAAAPNAAPGHFCFFETEAANAGANRSICRGGPAQCGATDPFGAGIYVYANAAGSLEILGTWAARPSGPVTNPSFSAAKPGAVNDAASSGTLASVR